MIPEKLRLSGFLSYHDPIEIDFSDIELACISGHNGAGKSSLLDAITWALFGEARRQDDAIINSRAEQAEVCLEFSYEGNRYRVLRVKPKGKTNLLEFNVLDADGNWKTLTEHSVTETKKRIEATLRMDYDTFTNASFFLQGKADQFAQQPAGNRKKILGSILGLEVWEDYRQGAADRRRVQERKLAEVEGQLKEIDAELAEGAARRDALEKLEKELKLLGELRKSKEEAFNLYSKRAADAENDRRRVVDLSSQLQAAQQRRDQHETRRVELTRQRGEYESQIAHAAEIEQDYQAWQAVRQELEGLEKLSRQFFALQQERSPLVTMIQSERARLESERDHLLKSQQEARSAETESAQVEREVKRAKSGLDQLSESVTTRDALKENLELYRQEKARLDQESRTFLAQRDEHKERIEHLEAVHEGICPLCGSDLSPVEKQSLLERLKKELGELQQQIDENEKAAKDNHTHLTATTVKLNEMTGLDQKVRQTQQRLFQSEARLNTLLQTQSDWQHVGAPRLAEVQQAITVENFAAEARQKLAEMDLQIQALGYDQAVVEAVRQKELNLRSSETRSRDLEKARSALAPLQNSIRDLEAELVMDDKEKTSLEASYAAANREFQQKTADLPDLDLLEQELKQTKENENRKRDEVGGARQKVEVLANLKERREELLAEKSCTNQQIARLKTLERAFGKDGVPALLIEQALPEIEENANTILDRLSNGAMSVRFATQREYKDRNREDKRETLDILISDPVGFREYEMFSGGEAFRINFAIRLALSRVLARRAGARLQTLVIDEGFGSQDADGRQRLIETINLVRGDFAKILVITHLEELKDAFPARIEVEKTAAGSSVQVLLA